MNISGASQNNAELIRQLFSTEKRERIDAMNARIGREQALPRFTGSSHGHPAFRGVDKRKLSLDELRAMMDPNHIKGLIVDPFSEPNHQKIDVPDHMREAMITFTREQFSRGLGLMDWQDGDRLAALKRSFIRNMPIQDRLNGLHTLNMISIEEGRRIESSVRQAMPSWMPGDPIPNNILAPILNGHGGFDTRA